MKNTSLKTRLAFGFVKAMKKTSMADKHKRRYHVIRAAAYASMASAVGPRKAWSRALLRNPKGTKTHHHSLRRRNPRNDDSGIEEELSQLSEVVPGGAAMDTCNLLNETAHYIKCLRAQLQIMTNILHFSST